MKNTGIVCLTLIVAVLISCSLFNYAFAQSSQVSYAINLSSYSLQVTYPSQVPPGSTVTVNVQATPKSNGVYLQTLTATIYYADASGLHSIATQTIVSNSAYGYGSYGSSAFSQSFTVSVPQNAPRTSLVAVFSETVQSNYYTFYYGYGPYYYGWGHSSYLFGGYPYSSYSATTDDAIAPLSYIQASTPEYVTLQSTYQMLQQQLNQTQGQLNQSQAQLKQSQSQNQQLQSTVSQQGAMINELNQRLANANTMTQVYQLVILALGIFAVLVVVFSVYQRRTKQEPPRTVNT